ncbi:MAG: hypothetical protein AAB343_02840 [Patescibacteria group bacterium]
MTNNPEKPYNPEGEENSEKRENSRNIVSSEQAAQLMGGEDKLERAMVGNVHKTIQELRKFPIGGTRLCVGFDENGEPIFKVFTSEPHSGDVDRLLKALDKYKTPVTGASWEGFTDPEI